MKVNWSGHLEGHPLVGRWFRFSSGGMGRCTAVREQDGELLLCFRDWSMWAVMSECTEVL